MSGHWCGLSNIVVDNGKKPEKHCSRIKDSFAASLALCK